MPHSHTERPAWKAWLILLVYDLTGQWQLLLQILIKLYLQNCWISVKAIRVYFDVYSLILKLCDHGVLSPVGGKHKLNILNNHGIKYCINITRHWVWLTKTHFIHNYELTIIYNPSQHLGHILHFCVERKMVTVRLHVISVCCCTNAAVWRCQDTQTNRAWWGWDETQWVNLCFHLLPCQHSHHIGPLHQIFIFRVRISPNCCLLINIDSRSYSNANARHTPTD